MSSRNSAAELKALAEARKAYFIERKAMEKKMKQRHFCDLYGAGSSPTEVSDDNSSAVGHAAEASSRLHSPFTGASHTDAAAATPTQSTPVTGLESVSGSRAGESGGRLDEDEAIVNLPEGGNGVDTDQGIGNTSSTPPRSCESRPLANSNSAMSQSEPTDDLVAIMEDLRLLRAHDMISDKQPSQMAAPSGAAKSLQDLLVEELCGCKADGAAYNSGYQESLLKLLKLIQ